MHLNNCNGTTIAKEPCAQWVHSTHYTSIEDTVT